MKALTTHYTPCHNKVTIRIVKAAHQLLHIPDAAQNPDDKAIIVAIGPKVDCCKPGDEIVPHPNANYLCLDKAEGLFLVDDSSILAIVTHGN